MAGKKLTIFFLILNRTCKSDSGLRAFSTNYRPPRGGDKIRALSGPSILPRPEDMISNEPELRAEESFEIRNSDPPVVLHPLPMPEYGGYFAQLTEFLPDITLPISGFHRYDCGYFIFLHIVTFLSEKSEFNLMLFVFLGATLL